LVHNAKLNDEQILELLLKSKQNKKKVNIPNTEKFLEGSQKFGMNDLVLRLTQQNWIFLLILSRIGSHSDTVEALKI